VAASYFTAPPRSKISSGDAESFAACRPTRGGVSDNAGHALDAIPGPAPALMPHLSPASWLLAAVGAFCLGVAKAGLAGLSLFHVMVFALLFGARDSTGIVLPMLLIGDACAIAAYRRQARWEYLRRMLPPAFVGILAGAAVMGRLSDAAFKPLVGWIILVLCVLQFIRMIWPDSFGDVPHGHTFAWLMGLLAGATTMLANAASPIMTIYFLAVALPKLEFVGTAAWFFFLVNAFKVPFSAGLGLIHVGTIEFNLLLSPAVVAGFFAGGWLIRRVPQQLFDTILMIFAAIAALKLIGAF
jgi:uncharacterized membrane protein YfcA